MKPMRQLKKRITAFGKDLVRGSLSYPPNVKQILSQYGNGIIKSITLKRTPVNGLLTGALSLFSLGKFGERMEKSFDEIFHLYMEIELQTGVRLTLEKNERINMEINPKQRRDEEMESVKNIPQGLTVNVMLENTRRSMGNQFFSYDAVNNNCQDFILSVFKSNGIGDRLNENFIKQDTGTLFRGLPVLKTIAHTATELGERANIVSQGGSISKKKDINTYGMILEHLVNHIKDPREPIDLRDYKQAIKVIDTIKQIKGGSIMKNKNYVVQTILFKKSMWNDREAVKWLKKHNYRGVEVDEKENTLRYRQYEPEYVKSLGFKKYKTKELNDGIDIVLVYK